MVRLNDKAYLQLLDNELYMSLRTENGIERPGPTPSLPDTLLRAGRAAALHPRATTRVPTSHLHHPCPYNDSEPLAGARRGHSKGGGGCGCGEETLVVALVGDGLTCPLRKVSGRESRPPGQPQDNELYISLRTENDMQRPSPTPGQPQGSPLLPCTAPALTMTTKPAGKPSVVIVRAGVDARRGPLWSPWGEVRPFLAVCCCLLLLLALALTACNDQSQKPDPRLKYFTILNSRVLIADNNVEVFGEVENSSQMK